MKLRLFILFLLLFAFVHARTNPGSGGVGGNSGSTGGSITVDCPYTITNTSQPSEDLFGLLADLGKKTNGVYNWLLDSSIVLIIAITIVALMFMGAKLSKLNQLEMMFRIELEQLFINIVFLVGITVFIVAIDAVIQGTSNLIDNSLVSCAAFSPGSSINSSNFKNCYAETLFKHYEDLIEGARADINSDFEALIKDCKGEWTWSFGVDFENIPLSISKGIWLSKEYIKDSKDKRLHLQIYSKILPSMVAFYVVFKYIIYYIAPLAFLLGIMLRIFPFTRRFGATLVGLGVSFAYIFPLLLVYLYAAGGLPGFGEASSPPSPSCPSQCFKSVVAYSNDKIFYSYDELMSYLKNNGATPTQIECFFNNTKNNKTTIGLDLHKDGTSQVKTFNICDNIAFSTAQQFFDDHRELEGMGYIYNGGDVWVVNSSIIMYPSVCPNECRKIPYPHNNALCRLAEPLCYALANYNNNEGYKCFVNLYNFSLLDKNVTYKGGEVKLKNALLDSKCFVLKGLAVPKKESPLIYCPSNCRFYYNDSTNPNDLACNDLSYRLKMIKSETDFNEVKNQLKACSDMVNGMNYNPKQIYENVINAIKGNNYANAKSQLETIFFDIKVKDNSTDCASLMDLKSNLKSIPPYIDCNRCIASLMVKNKKANLSYPDLLGKLILEGYVLPTIALAFTLLASSGISQWLGGEMFIPGLKF